MTYRIFAFIAVAAVIVGSLFLARQERAPQATTVRQNDSGEGYSARQAQLIETGSDGLPLYTVNAASIRQLPHEDRVQLNQVSMSFKDSSGNLWSATADQGAILQDASQVQLSGHVRVSASLLGAHAPLVITTDLLSFDSRASRVSTPDPVQLLWSGQKLQAQGLVANLKAHQLQLESSVHAIVSPSH